MEEQRKAVRRMQDYIHDHLSEEISMADLAKAASFSPWYARRIFIRYLGMTPAVYIRRLKLSRSALRLRDESGQILDVAMDMGYGSVDGYQRAFRREFGIKFITEKERSENKMSDTRNVFIQVVEKPARKVILKRGIRATEYWSYCEEVGCDVWGLLTSIRSISGEPVCLFLPEKLRNPAANEYVQGVEVEPDYAGEVPEGFEVIDLPASTYLLFRGEPFAEEDYVAAIGEIWDAEKKYDPAFIGFEWDNENPRIQLEPRGERGYIELVPVKKRG